jgi:hypothetical protein
MQYDIIIVENTAMPDGRDWLLIRHTGGDIVVLRRGALGQPQMIHQVWAAVREHPVRGVVDPVPELRVIA